MLCYTCELAKPGRGKVKPGIAVVVDQHDGRKKVLLGKLVRNWYREWVGLAQHAPPELHTDPASARREVLLIAHPVRISARGGRQARELRAVDMVTASDTHILVRLRAHEPWEFGADSSVYILAEGCVPTRDQVVEPGVRWVDRLVVMYVGMRIRVHSGDTLVYESVGQIPYWVPPSEMLQQPI